MEEDESFIDDELELILGDEEESNDSEEEEVDEGEESEEEIIEIPRRRAGEGIPRGRQGGTLTHTASGRAKTLHELATEESTDEDDDEAASTVAAGRRLNGHNSIVRGSFGSRSFEARVTEGDADQIWGAAPVFFERGMQATPGPSRRIESSTSWFLLLVVCIPNTNRMRACSHWRSCSANCSISAI